MGDVAIHGNGTYDHTKRQWKIRTGGLTASATVARLSLIFKADIASSERESRPYWLRYLAELRRVQVVSQADAELATARVKYASEDPPEYSPYQRDVTGEVTRKTVTSFDEIRVLNAASQLTDPTTTQSIKDWQLAQLTASLAPKPVPVGDSLKGEIDISIAHSRSQGGKSWFTIRQYLTMFMECCGPIPFREITVTHYREYHARVKAHATWGAASKGNAMQGVNMFLKRLESDHDLYFGFRSDSRYSFGRAEGKKIQYTLEQVQTALANARGIARCSLLLGLNCGFYWGDVTALTPENIKGECLTAVRVKNKNKSVKIEGTWFLWPETAAALQYGATKWQCEQAYRELRQAHNLPEHKALRKTIAQWIQDEVSEEAARLYRCEGVSGTHGRNYIKNFTPIQVAKLRAALTTIRTKLFGDVTP